MGGTIIAVSCFIGAMIWGILAGRKKRSTQVLLAKNLGFTFSADRDYQLPDEYAALSEYTGTNRFACNIYRGIYQELNLLAFDLHFDTEAGRQTQSFILDKDKDSVLFSAGNSITKEDLKTRLPEILEQTQKKSGQNN